MNITELQSSLEKKIKSKMMYLLGESVMFIPLKGNIQNHQLSFLVL